MTTTTTKNRNRRQVRELREAVCSLPTFWNGAGEALAHLTDLLRSHGLDVGDELTRHADEYGNRRWTYQLLNDETGEEVTDSVLVWMTYDMPSGRVEVTCYLS